MLIWMLVGVVCGICGMAVVDILRKKKKSEPFKEVSLPVPAPVVNLKPILDQLDINRARSQRDLDQLPGAVLQALNGSLNAHKGKIGEMIGYITLKAQYDRVVPLGSIVDFVGIRFPNGDDPGCVHFIDIKTGDGARLSRDQKHLKTLLTRGDITFVTMKIDTVEGFPDEADND